MKKICPVLLLNVLDGYHLVFWERRIQPDLKCICWAIIGCWIRGGFDISGCTRKTRIIDVVYNASNNELVRTKTLVKNCIVLVDSTPYRQWYESHYALPLGRKKGAKLVRFLYQFSLLKYWVFNSGLSLMITLSSSATEWKWCSLRLWGRLVAYKLSKDQKHAM